MKVIGAICIVIILFLLIYVPAFVLISALHLSKSAMIPIVIIETSIVAFLIIGTYAWLRKLTLADFGLQRTGGRHLIYALVISVPLATLAALGAARIHEPGPLQGLVLAPALSYLYFGLGAPVQEEIIFRGLLQTVFADRLRNSFSGARAELSAVFVVGLLFALIHFEVGPFTAACALVLGLVAGELRRRSRSVAPAILCHAVFNLAAIVLS